MPYIWPLGPEFPVTQEFGSNPNNGVNPAGGHTGRDFATPIGTAIRAPGDGVIEWSDWVDDSWEDNLLWLRGGIAVVLNCGDAEPTFVFGHLNDAPLNAGDRVRKGDIIGYTGNTGYSSGPHLHFEVLLPGFLLATPTLGRSDPRRVCSGYWTGSVSPASGPVTPIGPGTRTVTNDVAWARVAPFSGAAAAPNYPEGIAKGSALSVVGYVKGEDPYGTGDDAWYKTVSGYFVWANAAGNDIGGLQYLGDMSGQKPAPAPAPTPAPAPAPAPTPQPAPAAYDFALDFVEVNGIRVEKIPAAVGNFGVGNFPAAPFKVVKHWWNDPALKPLIDGVIAEFRREGSFKSAHFVVGADRIVQMVSLKDRAYHAAAVGNDWVGIEIDPRATEDSAYGERIRANVRALHALLDEKYGYHLLATLHKDVPQCSTTCSGLNLALLENQAPAPAPAPEPAPQPAPVPVPTPSEESVVRAFLARVVEWLIANFVTAKK